MLKDEDTNKEDEFISFKEDEEFKIRKSIDLLRFKDKKDIKTYSEELMKKKYYDIKRNEKFILKPFYTVDKLIPKNYCNEIVHDNAVLLKNKNEKDSFFIEFLETLTKAFDLTLRDLELNEKTAMELTNKLLIMNFEDLTSQDKQCVNNILII